MTDELPKTLIDAVSYYRDPKVCFETMLAVKWPDGKITCPKCGTSKVGVIMYLLLLIVEGRRELLVQCGILCIGCWTTQRLVRGTGTKT